MLKEELDLTEIDNILTKYLASKLQTTTTLDQKNHF